MDKLPIHRRPSWAKNEGSYEAYMRNDWAKVRGDPSSTRSQDYGIENFSFDDKHLDPFLMPKELRDPKAMPSKMTLTANDWAKAGAAIDTALERIDKLRAEAITRGWPDKSHTSHLQRSHWVRKDKGHSSPAVSGAESPTLSSPPMSPSPLLPAAALPLQRNAVLPPLNAPEPKRAFVAPNPPPMGMESPPFTPVNSQAPGTPSDPIEGLRSTPPDLSKINSQLSPSATSGALSPPQSATSSFSPSTISPTSTPVPQALTPAAAAATSTFDENAWDTYIRSFNAELTDLREKSLQRFKGFGHDQDLLIREFGGAHASGEFGESVKKFAEWREGQKRKLKEYEEKVRGLRVPELEEVKKERTAKGLAV